MSDAIVSALLAANEAFYDAFDTGDAGAMAALWAKQHPVACVHPGAPPMFGRREVVESWVAILGNLGRPAIQCQDPQAIPFDQGGEQPYKSGIVVCQEVLAGGTLLATNAFVTEDGIWRMVHHHASPLNR